MKTDAQVERETKRLANALKKAGFTVTLNGTRAIHLPFPQVGTEDGDSTAEIHEGYLCLWVRY